MSLYHSMPWSLLRPSRIERPVPRLAIAGAACLAAFAFATLTVPSRAEDAQGDAATSAPRSAEPALPDSAATAAPRLRLVFPTRSVAVNLSPTARTPATSATLTFAPGSAALNTQTRRESDSLRTSLKSDAPGSTAFAILVSGSDERLAYRRAVAIRTEWIVRRHGAADRLVAAAVTTNDAMAADTGSVRVEIVPLDALRCGDCGQTTLRAIALDSGVAKLVRATTPEIPSPTRADREPIAGDMVTAALPRPRPDLASRQPALAQAASEQPQPPAIQPAPVLPVQTPPASVETAPVMPTLPAPVELAPELLPPIRPAQAQPDQRPSPQRIPQQAVPKQATPKQTLPKQAMPKPAPSDQISATAPQPIQTLPAKRADRIVPRAQQAQRDAGTWPSRARAEAPRVVDRGNCVRPRIIIDDYWRGGPLVPCSGRYPRM